MVVISVGYVLFNSTKLSVGGGTVAERSKAKDPTLAPMLGAPGQGNLHKNEK